MSSIKRIRYKTFSQAFSKALEIRSLSNRKFAKLMDKDEGQVSHWANGVHKPYKRTQEKICEVLQVEINEVGNEYELLYEDENTDSLDSDSSESNEKDPVIRFRLAEKEIDKVEEPSLDYLRELYRLRDKLDEKIQKLVGRKKNSDDSS